MKKIRYFFCQKEKCLARHALNLEKKNYIGFYYSKRDAAAMKKTLQEKYSTECEVKAFPCDFKLINAAYFETVFH